MIAEAGKIVSVIDPFIDDDNNWVVVVHRLYDTGCCRFKVTRFRSELGGYDKAKAFADEQRKLMEQCGQNTP